MEKSSEKEKALALLQKYREGRCTPQEALRIKRWFDSFDNIPDNLSDDDARRAADEAACEALIKLFGKETVHLPAARKSPVIYALSRIAACLLLAWGIYFIAARSKRSKPDPITYTSFSSGKGERREIELPDRSVITLNAASTIRIASDFGVKDRKVSLQGEAFFQVSKDKSRPFLIKTGKIQTRVIGTSFNINAYPDENAISVAVATGTVQVEKEEATGEKLIGKNLTHNHLLVYNIKTGAYRNVLANASLLSAWRSNKLVFDKASMTQIAHVLERRFNIPVQIIGRPQKSNLYTVTFDNYSLDKLLPLLAELTGVSYEITKGRLILNIHNCR
ncbi:MAG: FecR family protein [Mucilaginibacter sp.]